MKKNILTFAVAFSMLALTFTNCKKPDAVAQEDAPAVATSSEHVATMAATRTSFSYERGINLSTWLSHMLNGATNGQGAIGYVTEAHIQQLRADGFDHIRLPIDEKMYYTNSGTFTKDATTVQLIKDCIGWCAKYNMRVILDFHIPGSRVDPTNKKENYWTNPALRAHAVELWKQ